MIETSVLVVGAGPVGLTLAMDLASRGIDVTVTEIRRAGEPPNVKCNQVSARSMEIFRRLGISGKIRDTGLPAEYRNDVSCCVSVTGTELSRIKLPSRAGRLRGEKGDDNWWPTPEPPHRINQLFLEPTLFAHAVAQPRIRILNRTQFEQFSQDAMAIDGKETWLIHNFLYNDESDYDSIDRDWAIRQILGVAPDFEVEIISKEDWIGRRLVADRFQSGRVFIAGDAAHLWIPHAGYGMNAGIADAANLSWMLAAVLNGWAESTLLDAYQAERQPITDQVSRFAFEMAREVSQQRREISADIERQDAVGEATRATIGKEAYDLYIQQQCCAGLNFGYFYGNSPIIAYDGEAHPDYSMGRFTSSSVPGCRAPHFWLCDGRSLYDALGEGYSLIRFAPDVAISGLMAAAAQRGMPLFVLDVDDAEAAELYARKLALVRPDQHVAWRGDKEPAAPMDLIDLVRGALLALARRAA